MEVCFNGRRAVGWQVGPVGEDLLGGGGRGGG